MKHVTDYACTKQFNLSSEMCRLDGYTEDMQLQLEKVPVM